MNLKNLLCKLGIHKYGTIVFLDSKITLNKYGKNIVKYKKCKKCNLKKVGREFIIKGEYHYEVIDDKLLKKYYKGYY